MPKMLAAAKTIAYHGISKYHFERHDSNNSAWTQHHELLDDATLREYLNVYDDRTRWLCEHFPDKAKEWNYYNWSFMISMVEKVKRLNLNECDDTCNQIIESLKRDKNDFMQSPLIENFERNWMEQYIFQGEDQY